MNKRLSAIDTLMGRLFDEQQRQAGSPRLMKSRAGGRGGKSVPVRYGHNSISASRMSRMGGHHGMAIFKLVRGSGVANQSGLKGQLNYIFNDDKVARVIDPSGIAQPHDQLSPKQINRLTNELSQNWWSNTRNGNTTHMILSYPQGTSIDDVAAITRAVCEEKFNSGDDKFKYVASIHDDQEHHPHAHIVLNRRAENGRLFHMRQGTEHSYEGFREAMAAHAERRGIYLDPTNRFERGVTDRQPSRDEQLSAQNENRPPIQRARSGADLEYARDQATFARIATESLAVIAANADCPHMERAFRDVSKIIETAEGDFVMPELTNEETEQFNQYADLLNDTLQRTQDLMDTKDAAARVPMEVRMTETMQEFTSLNPNAGYAESLHQPPAGNSIYMNETTTSQNTWEWNKPQLAEMASDRGLDGEAVAARLEVGASNQYLEQMWMQDDLKKISTSADLDIEDPVDRQEAISELTNAYQAIRDEMLERDALYPVPQHQTDYRGADGQIQLTQAERDSFEGQFKSADFTYPYADDSAARETGRVSTEAAIERFETFAQRSTEHASFASEIWDDNGRDFTKPDGYVALEDRERTLEATLEASNQRDDFGKFKERSGDQYSVSNNAEEHQEVVRLIKENTTDAEYQRFRDGDVKAVDRITDDPVFARQLLAEVELNNRASGYEMSDETERLMEDNRAELTVNFENDRDQSREMDR